MGLIKPEKPIGRFDSAFRRHPARPPRQSAEDHRLDQLAGGAIARDRERRENRLRGKPDAWNLIFLRQLDEDIGERGMHMKIQMAVDVIQVSDQFQMQLDLRAAFGVQLVAEFRE